MKGKATLTLSEAATGKVVQRVEESNMVTNAISRLFNPPQEALIDTNWLEQMAAMLPMWKNILGGIILLGNTLEESKDNGGRRLQRSKCYERVAEYQRKL